MNEVCRTFGIPLSTKSVTTLQKNLKTDYYSTALILALKMDKISICIIMHSKSAIYKYCSKCKCIRSVKDADFPLELRFDN